MMKIRDFAAGSHHAAMVDELGRVFTWGAGSYGRSVILSSACLVLNWVRGARTSMYIDYKTTRVLGLG